MRAIFVFSLFITKGFSEDCHLDVSDPESPFITTYDLEFPDYDENQSITIAEEDIFFIVCPKGTQSSSLKNENGDRISCVDGTSLLNIDTRDYIDFSDIKCKPYDLTIVTKSDQKCFNGKGTIFDIGFEIYSKILSEIEVCFDEKKLTTIYCKYNNQYSAKTFLKKSESNSNYELLVCSDSTKCDWSDSGNLYSTITIDGAYDDQNERFQELGVNTSLTVVRYPLATNLWQLNLKKNRQEIEKAPYYDYINVVPVWKSDVFNEVFTVLDLALGNDDYYMSSIVYAGTLGVATLPNESGEDVELYLVDDEIPVSKWLWMVWDKMEVIFFYYNHPNTQESIEAIEQVCSPYNNLTTSMFTCDYGNVIDADMKQLIEDNFV